MGGIWHPGDFLLRKWKKKPKMMTSLFICAANCCILVAFFCHLLKSVGTERQKSNVCDISDSLEGLLRMQQNSAGLTFETHLFHCQAKPYAFILYFSCCSSVQEFLLFLISYHYEQTSSGKKISLCCNNKIGFETAEIWLVRVVPGSGGALGYPHACFVPRPYSPATGVCAVIISLL